MFHVRPYPVDAIAALSKRWLGVDPQGRCLPGGLAGLIHLLDDSLIGAMTV